MSIRLATISDAEIIKDIYQAAIEDIPQRQDLNIKQRAYWISSGDSLEVWESVINSQNVFVYEKNSTIVGFVSVLNDYVKYIYVHPNSKGNGIGFELLEFAENFAKNNGVVFLKAETSGAAYRLFHLRGFQKMGEISKFVPNTAGLVFHRFQKDLINALEINKAEGVIQPSVEVKSHL